MQNRSDVQWVDLGAVVVFTVFAGGTVVVPVPSWVVTLVALPFLLVVPGYALLAALFPRRTLLKGGSDDGFRGIELLLLTVVTSIATAIVTGVNLEFTPFLIEAETVVGALVGITLVATAVAVFRRIRHPDLEPGRHEHALRVNGGIPKKRTATIANVAVVIAVVAAIGSVAIVAGTPQRGEAYTELGLLVENETGELVATGYPSEISMGESTPLSFTVVNKEKQKTEYVVVIQLAKTGPDGSVVEQSVLDTYRADLAAGESWQQKHRISPDMVGENLRLTYLLYRDSAPDTPTVQNAYRETHIWVDVEPRGA